MHLIIGNSTAAIAAIEGIREVDSNADITVISQENHHCYSRPLISYLLAGKIRIKDIYYRPLDFYDLNKVNLCLGQKVERIDTVNKKVSLLSGENLEFDNLLLASGSSSVIPSIFEGDYNNLFTFSSLDDVIKISNYINGQKHLKVVVVGGGLIGLKAAESLTILGQDVTVVESANHLLSSILNSPAAHIVQSYLKKHSIQIICDNFVSEIDFHQKHINNLILENGEVISCDILVIATGMKPAIPKITGEQLQVEKGVIVDNHMQTSIPQIYAAGDVAQGWEFLSQQNKWLPILPSAFHQGRIAGLNMAGSNIINTGQVAFNSIPLLGLQIVTAGISNPDNNSYVFLEKKTSDTWYRRLVLKDGNLQGFIFIGDIKRAGIYRNLIQKQINVDHLKTKLLEGDIGLADLPAELGWGDFLR